MKSGQSASRSRTQDTHSRERPSPRQGVNTSPAEPSNNSRSPEVRGLLQQGAAVAGPEAGEEGQDSADDEFEEYEQHGNARSEYAVSMYPGARSVFRAEHSYESGHDSATIDSARTLYADDFDFVMEHGRQYCGDYFLPCDTAEQTRQFVNHQVYLKFFDLELTLVPLEHPSYILDIGTGIGEWAIGMAEKYPGCEVFGTDIAPIQPTHQVPFNVEFHIENAEDEWIRPADTVDLVHLRNMQGAFSDWRFIYDQAFACIRPGGWIEVVDWEDFFADKNFSAFFPEDSACHTLVQAMLEVAETAGKPENWSHLDKDLLTDAGFVDIEEAEYDMGIGARENSSYGSLCLVSIMAGVEANCLRPLAQHLGWDADEVRELCTKVSRETRAVADDPARVEPFAVKLRVVVGRKPFAAAQWTAKPPNETGEINDYCSGDECTVGARTIRSERTM